MKPEIITFSGPPIDDRETFQRLPACLQMLLNRTNGFIIYNGGLHIRGACKAPAWHSLREAWQGKMAFYRHYSDIKEEDVPFAQDCVGDQFMLRENEVIILRSEDGSVEPLSLTLDSFLKEAESDPINTLGMHPVLGFANSGETLQPGQLLLAYPPFCTKESDSGVHLSAVPAEELISFHIEFNSFIGGLGVGDKFVVKVE